MPKNKLKNIFKLLACAGFLSGGFIGIPVSLNIIITNALCSSLSDSLLLMFYLFVFYGVIGIFLGCIFVAVFFLVKPLNSIRISRKIVVACIFAPFIIGLLSVFSLYAHNKKHHDIASAKPFAMPVYPTNTKVIVIGIDGATWNVMDPLIAEGRLPNLAKLMANGSYGKLRTIMPTYSPVIWTSIATGKTAEKHGIHNFVSFALPGIHSYISRVPSGVGVKRLRDALMSRHILKIIPPNSMQRNVAAIWNIASAYDKKVGMVGWNASWPAEPVNGFNVTDRILYAIDQQTKKPKSESKRYVRGVDSKTVFPDNLFEECAKFKRERNDITDKELSDFLKVDTKDLPEFFSAGDKFLSESLDALKLHYLTDQFYTSITLNFFPKYNPDILLFYIHGLDSTEHRFWKYYEPKYFPGLDAREIAEYCRVIPEYYIYVDKLVGKIISLIDENTVVFVISDHGHEAEISTAQPGGGGHNKAPAGIIIISGKNIKKGEKINNASVLDITPTILYLMGLPVAKDMDGEIILEPIEPGLAKSLPIYFIDTYGRAKPNTDKEVTDAPGDEDIIKHFRSLGYIN